MANICTYANLNTLRHFF